MTQNGDFAFNLSTKESKGDVVLSTISRFAKSYSEIIGLKKYTPEPILIGGRHINTNSKELVGGARMNYIINDIFNKTINLIDPFDKLTDEVAIYLLPSFTLYVISIYA